MRGGHMARCVSDRRARVSFSIRRDEERLATTSALRAPLPEWLHVEHVGPVQAADSLSH